MWKRKNIFNFKPFQRGEVLFYVLSWLRNATSYLIDMYGQHPILFDVEFDRNKFNLKKG